MKSIFTNLNLNLGKKAYYNSIFFYSSNDNKAYHVHGEKCLINSEFSKKIKSDTRLKEYFSPSFIQRYGYGNGFQVLFSSTRETIRFRENNLPEFCPAKTEKTSTKTTNKFLELRMISGSTNDPLTCEITRKSKGSFLDIVDFINIFKDISVDYKIYSNSRTLEEGNIDCKEECSVTIDPPLPEGKVTCEVVSRGVKLSASVTIAPEESQTKSESQVSVTLTVDPSIYKPPSQENPYGRSLNKELNPYNDDVVSTYDPLICTLSIPFESEMVFFRISRKADDQKKVIKSGTTTCYDSICSIDISSMETNRGEEIECEFIYNNEKFTDNVFVAEMNYFFVELNPPGVVNLNDQLDYYERLSSFEREDLKAIFRKNCVVTSDEFFPRNIERAKEICIEYINPELDAEELEECALNYALDRYNYQIDLEEKIGSCLEESGEQFNIKFDRIIGHSKKFVGASRAFPESGLVLLADDDITLLAHEIAHTYGVCDEDDYSQYKKEDLTIKCPNDYPWCAIDSPENPFIIGIDGKASCTANGGECFYAEGLYNPETPDNYLPVNFKCPKIDGGRNECSVTYERFAELGNNCYPSGFIEKLDRKEAILAALYLAGVPIPDTKDLNSPLRSIMGYPIYRENGGEVSYPDGLPYPLGPKN